MESNAFSKLSFFISVLALSFSAYTWWISSKSILKVFIKHDKSSLSFAKTQSELYPVVLVKNSEIQFSNIGNVSTSLKSIDLSLVHPLEQYLSEKDNYSFIDKMNNSGFVPYRSAPETRSLLDTTDIFYDDQGHKIIFPLRIEPKNIVKVNLKIRIPISKITWGKVSEKINIDNNVRWGEIFPVVHDLRVISENYIFFILSVTKEDGYTIYIPFDPFLPNVYTEGFF